MQAIPINRSPNCLLIIYYHFEEKKAVTRVLCDLLLKYYVVLFQ